MPARMRQWGTWAAFAGLGLLALAGGGVLVVALLELIGFSPRSSLVFGTAALPVLAVAYLLIATIARRWRFSLRTLLLFYVLCGLGLTHFVSQRNSLRQREEAVQKLSQLQARFTYAESKTPVWLQDLVGRDHFENRPVVGVVLVPSKTKFITDQTLTALAGLPNLRSLELFGPQVTDRGLQSLHDLSQLEVAALRGVPITDRGLAHVAQLYRLRELYLDSTRITDGALEHIGHLTNLEVLHLDGSGLTDASIERLARFKKLRQLSLNDTLVSGEGVAQLRQLMPRTEIRHENVISRDQRMAVERIGQLGGVVDRDARTNRVTTVDLAINRGANVGNQDLAVLASLSDLETLELGNNPWITDDGLKALSGLTNLKTLHLYNTGVRGPGLRHLAALPDLQGLNLQGAPLTDEAIVHLQKLSSLKWLNLTGTPVSATAFEKLQAALPGVKSAAESN